MGYIKDLLILPFDHRGSLLKKLFGIEKRQPTAKEAQEFSELKQVVFEGFQKSLELGVPKNTTAILVDEQFGSKILTNAKKLGIKTAMPIEKSGQDEFDFEEPDFKAHIARVDPFFVKVLVRFNPEGNKETNTHQLEKLKKASNHAKKTGKKFIFELLVPPEQKQLNQLGQNKEKFEKELRPKLMVQAIKEIQNAGIEPDVWKLEGVEKIEDSKALVQQVQANNRTAGIITLGRGENEQKVKEWLKIGAKVKGIIGFAVGRTVFMQPITDFYEKKITRQQAINQIAENYKTLVDLWNKEKKTK